MARNAEKAMTTLARWRAAQVQEAGGQRERRPYLASECNDLPQAEKWRLQIVREIAKKVAQIQNGTKMEPGSTEELTAEEYQRTDSASADIPPENLQAQVTPSSNRSRSPTPKQGSIKTEVNSVVSQLEPQGKTIIDHVEELTDTVKHLSQTIHDPNDPILENNVDKIAKMSQVLTSEANALRMSIRSLTEDISRTKQEIQAKKEDVNFPYHLFLVELIVNKIHMKCDCFEFDHNNLVISADFLGKHVILYNSTFGKPESLSRLNVGKSTLFAMTYDKICSIEEFEVTMQLTKEPPCSTCVTKLAETRLDYTEDFIKLREELCKKWQEEQPFDNIICTTSTPLNKNMYYLSCGDSCSLESIGVIEVSFRMSFLGKEITTTFNGNPRARGTSLISKEDNGISMYSCQKVEMDDEGKILLDEEAMNRREPCNVLPLEDPNFPVPSSRSFEPRGYRNHNPYVANRYAGLGEFRIRDLNDEINKLMREKRHWEVQIKSLGGPDYARVGPKMLDQDGKEVPGNRGYKYFGAAKDLPGVRELFEQEPPPPPRRTRADLMRDVDADYYGYRDDDDGLLMPLEQAAEKESIAQAVEEWKANKEQHKEQDLPEEENIYPEDPDDKRIDDEDGEEPVHTSHVAVPSQKDIEEALLRRKKQELLERYGCLDVKMEES